MHGKNSPIIEDGLRSKRCQKQVLTKMERLKQYVGVKLVKRIEEDRCRETFRDRDKVRKIQKKIKVR